MAIEETHTILITDIQVELATSRASFRMFKKLFSLKFRHYTKLNHLYYIFNCNKNTSDEILHELIQTTENTLESESESSTIHTI